MTYALLTDWVIDVDRGDAHRFWVSPDRVSLAARVDLTSFDVWLERPEHERGTLLRGARSVLEACRLADARLSSTSTTPIGDDEQRAVTAREAEKFRAAIAAAGVESGGSEMRDLSLAAMRSQLETLDNQLRAYDAYVSRKRRAAAIREKLQRLCEPDADGWVRAEVARLDEHVAAYEARLRACVEKR